MLYRLDYIDPGTSGEDTEPVRESGRDVLTRHMTTARAKATAEAERSMRAILITRIGNAGIMRPTLVVEPDGTARRPPTSRAVGREDCKRGTGQPCFCSPCRAERRNKRT